MNTTIKLLALGALFLAACGDNREVVDAPQKDASADANCSNCPAAPTLGAQIDRMGRPAINTALTHGFDATAATQPAKVAYNQDSDPSGWVAANTAEFMKNLGIIDALDTGYCGNGRCETGETNALVGACPADCPTANQVGAGDGCGNQVVYVPGAGGVPTTSSYGVLAGVLANDELYLDTGKTTCTVYLAVEFAFTNGAPGSNQTCGGRAPNYDVIDYSLSALAVGLGGFTNELAPKFGDTVPPHDDYLTAFPFLGMPH